MAKGKNSKRKNTVAFEEETITKETADKILSNLQHVEESKVKQTGLEEPRKGKKGKKGTNGSQEDTAIQETEKVNKKKRKRDKDNQKPADKFQKVASQADTSVSNENEEGDKVSENVVGKTAESKRAKKRQKHADLVEQQKLKSQLNSQESALNYLSKWKHGRSEWKFEKLRQIWISQNLFDSVKIPDEFWATVLEYFSESKGFIRNVVLRDAMKVIEEEKSEDNEDKEYVLKLQRARDIVQNLQI